jgi:8-oxo-dGTP pyrophosphatase MutT (NUDIX family)
MKKPNWHRRSSHYLVDSPFMRLRADELELPDGTIVPQYFVRESPGFVVAFAMTADERVVMVRQYRYGSDEIHLELPAGMLDDGEDPLACARRELAEETGYEAAEWESIGAYYAEPVRSTAKCYVFIAHRASKVREAKLDATEVLEVELLTIHQLRAMLRDGRIDTGHSVSSTYRALDRLNRL